MKENYCMKERKLLNTYCMKYQKTINLSDNTPNQLSKFKTKD